MGGCHNGSVNGRGTGGEGADAAPVSAPADLRVAHFELQGRELAVLSFPVAGATEAPPSLSPAEREVLAGILDGLSNAWLAQARGTSVRTVANQVASIFDKRGVSSRTELVARMSRGRDPGDPE